MMLNGNRRCMFVIGKKHEASAIWRNGKCLTIVSLKEIKIIRVIHINCGGRLWMEGNF